MTLPFHVSTKLKILILEDVPADADLMNIEMKRGGLDFTSICVDKREDFLAALEPQPPDVILSDHGLPAFDGFTALQEVKQRLPHTPFIFVTGSVGEDAAIEAFERGADAYVLKAKLSNLAPAVRRALDLAGRRQTVYEHEQHLRAILDSAREFAIFTTDLNGLVTTWNAGAEHLFGYSADQIIGQEGKIIFTPEDLARGQHLKEMDESSRHGRFVNERWHIRKNGERFWGSGQMMTFLNAQGKISGFLKIMQDHTDRIRMEEALQQSEELHRSLVQSAHDHAIYMLDFQGNVASWNQGAERVEGYKAEEIIGRPYSVFFTDEDILKGLPAQELERARTTGKSRTEGWALRRDGSQFWSDWTLSALAGPRGEVKGYCKIARDITGKKKQEEENIRLKEELEQRVRRRTADLEATNKELEAFSYSISHDLRAPLRHIAAYAGFLQETVGEGTSGDGRLYLEKISTSAARMTQLIDDLLTFSRMGRTQLTWMRIDLSKLVAEVRAIMQEDTKDRNITWKIGELPDVEGDLPTLRQVFVNLISNAVKYTRSRPEPVIEIGSTHTEEEIIFHVRDNGVGFDMHFAQKLFGLFQRLHSDKDYPGTGIGLAIVRRILRRHGGRIWAESSVGKGATFYFTIPSRSHSSVENHPERQDSDSVDQK